MKTYKDIVGDGGSDVVGQVTEHAARVQARMASVKRIVAVMSGKGGVGKSSVTVNLASAFAMQGKTVGVLDADINGPSVARMIGAQDQALRRNGNGVFPATGFADIKVMSTDLFLQSDDAPVLWDAPTQKDAFTWRGMMEAVALREFVADTVWGELDYLLIDLPPGSDKLPNIADILPRLSGVVVVTLPTAVSQFVVGKSISMAKQLLQTPILGIVENMSAYICAKCGEQKTLFSSGGVDELAEKFETSILGKIPFDPHIALAADSGEGFLEANADSVAAKEILRIANCIKSLV